MPRHTSIEMAELASQVLNDPRSSNTARQLAGSVLSQHAPHDSRGAGQRRTSSEMAKLASQVLDDPNSSPTVKKLAGSVLSQRAE